MALGTTLEGGVLLGQKASYYEDLQSKCFWQVLNSQNVDRESQLYDEFERFKMLPGENINEYYVRFHMLVNDMRNIIMTMPNIQPETPNCFKGRQNQNQRYFARGNGAAGNKGAQNRAGNANAGQGKPDKCYNCNGVGHISRNFLNEEELLFLAADECDAFDSDVDDEPTA
ncbi:integrase, catalytic region, zinc finger, CCHC-type containing protein [Tanacetum coccineum]|uniref:Integrase, catalytic region, zinc finger, CCHC-type containing protein n=1 Tax=Tanacetum coccineum TaxID=301880 RepID=A0ABQ5CXF1_9ASTR